MPSDCPSLQFPQNPPLPAEAGDGDIYYAYRLLLGREPDADGFEHYRHMLKQRSRPPQELARNFLVSDEFAANNNVLPVEVQLDGYSLFIRPDDRDIGEPIRAARQYEPHVTKAVRELLRPGSVFVDVGANIGFFTNLAAHLVGSSGRVIAIEPMDKNLQLIFQSLEANRFEHVRVHACAASDGVAIVCLATGPATSNGQVITGARRRQPSLRAQSRPLDDLTADLARIDLVKLDIEGYELLAWRGFREGLRKHRPSVLTEFHPYCMRTYVGIEPTEYLDELFGYATSVQVLAHDRNRTVCSTPGDVMRQWEITDNAMRGDGTSHLDLLIQPGN